MLKIKDNVDLKELEKYGLKPLYSVNENTGETYIRCIVSQKYTCRFGDLLFKPKKNGWRTLKIFSNRIIENHLTKNFIFDDDNFVDVDLLYDLIKEGLVEKVNE